MESYIKLSTLNDFIFCPKSIYYHGLYDNYEKKTYQDEVQIAGTIAHESVDTQNYSTSKYILQGMEVYSDHYGIAGKIDTFDTRTGELVERKNQIHIDTGQTAKIYLGYKYQLRGQMFCLEEMGYHVEKLAFYSMKDNKKYRIYKPSTDDILKFEAFLGRYRKFNLLEQHWRQNPKKCLRCIYRELCDYFIGEIYPQLQLFE